MGGGTAFFYEWGSGLFSFTVPIIKCKSAKDWHCKNFVHEFCKFFAFFYKTAGTQLISVVKFGLKKSLFISQPVLVQDLARVIERRP